VKQSSKGRRKHEKNTKAQALSTALSSKQKYHRESTLTQPIHLHLTPDLQPQVFPDDLVHNPRITKSEKPNSAAESSRAPSTVYPKRISRARHRPMHCLLLTTPCTRTWSITTHDQIRRPNSSPPTSLEL